MALNDLAEVNRLSGNLQAADDGYREALGIAKAIKVEAAASSTERLERCLSSGSADNVEKNKM